MNIFLGANYINMYLKEKKRYRTNVLTTESEKCDQANNEIV